MTNPFAIINTIHSGLMSELGKHYRISILSDLLTQDDIHQFNKHFDLNMYLLNTPVPMISRYAKWLRIAQMLFFGFYFDLQTIRIKLMERGTLFCWLFSQLRKSQALTFLSGWFVILIRNLLIRHTTLPSLCASLAANGFEAVVSTSPLDIRENTIANSLYTRGIPCISIIISWDNLTSKGLINTKSSLVLVWNELMALEYDRFYAMFGDITAVRIAGIPRFDIYDRNPPPRCPNIANKLASNAKIRTILFSTGALKHHSCQNHIIDDLLEYAGARHDIRIWVRCHPSDDPGRYARFSGVENLSFFQPFGRNTHRIPPVDFLTRLHSDLMGCDVCVQVASTMFLDAAVCNKPCISIAYDAALHTPYAGSVKRFYDYSHQLPLRSHVDEHMVYDRRALFEKLDEVLWNHTTPADLRNHASSVIHRRGNNSVRLTSQYIREWLG